MTSEVRGVSESDGEWREINSRERVLSTLTAHAVTYIANRINASFLFSDAQIKYIPYFLHNKFNYS
jgi:hypothetical protein